MTFTSLNPIGLDLRVLLFTAATGIGVTIAFGTPPAFMASRRRGGDIRRDSRRSIAGSIASRRLRATLVVVEIALALVLLMGASLMGRSFANLQSISRGFDTNGLVVLHVGFIGTANQDSQGRDFLSARVVTDLQSLPGVRGVTVGAIPPEASRIRSGSVEFAHAPTLKTDKLILPIYDVWPDYFEQLRLPIVAGRPFAENEPRESVIVSESFARAYWPDASALGGRFHFSGSAEWWTIVGVAAEVRQWKLDDATGAFEWYMPMRLPPVSTAAASAVPPTADNAIGYRMFALRSDDPAAAILNAARALQSVDSRLALLRASAVDDLFHDAVAEPRLVLFLLGVFSAIGLILAAGGIYGVLTHLVTARWRELGLRFALGAKPGDVFRMILRGGLGLAAAGIAVGSVLALAVMRLMRTILYEVEPVDPLSGVAVVGVVAIVALVAAWRPARRATQVDPATLLRQE
jgi:predicted permease